MFAVVTLGYLADIAERVYANGALRAEALALRQQIDDGNHSPRTSTFLQHISHTIHSLAVLQWNQFDSTELKTLFEFQLGPHRSCSRQASTSTR
jgi:meiotically up-regulated gene 157 (Mug157) protein